jgi:hypothetical protein
MCTFKTRPQNNITPQFFLFWRPSRHRPPPRGLWGCGGGISAGCHVSFNIALSICVMCAIGHIRGELGCVCVPSLVVAAGGRSLNLGEFSNPDIADNFRMTMMRSSTDLCSVC